MNSFMNALWNATGSMVTGFYNDEPFIGSIESVRTKAGTELSVAIRTDDELIMLTGTELCNGEGNLTSNLHVYF